MKTTKIICLLCFVVALLTARAQAGDFHSTLTGPAFKATLVAYDKFKSEIAKESKYGELGIFLSKIENYDVAINEEGDAFSIEFTPRLYQGGHLKGGGAEYLISKKDYAVLKFQIER